MFAMEPKREGRESCEGLFYCLNTLQSCPFLYSFLGQKHTFGNWRKVLNFDKWDCLESARKYWKAQKKLFHLEFTRKIYKKIFSLLLLLLILISLFPMHKIRHIFTETWDRITAFYHLKKFRAARHWLTQRGLNNKRLVFFLDPTKPLPPAIQC
jgi:hypothetical protein